MSIISQNLKYLRRLNGLTQEQLARHLGIKRPSVGAYEEARAHPPYDVLTSLSKKFGVTVDQLIKTDLRRVRETPDLGLMGTPAPAAPLPAVAALSAPPRPLTEPEAPKPIATVIEKYYREKSQVPLVAQRITLRRLSLRDGMRVESAPVREASTPPAPPGTAQVQLVWQAQAEEYMHRHTQEEFVRSLPTFTLPMLPAGTYRAFEVNEDFPFPGALLVGAPVRSGLDVADGKSYVLVLRAQGIVFRRVYNQVKFKGTLLLSADHTPKPSQEVALKEVLEIWEVRLFVSSQLPEPDVSLERVRTLVQELNQELDRLKR